MKRIILVLIALTAFTASFLEFSVSYYPIPEEGDLVRKRAEWFYEQRAFGLGYIPPGAREKAWEYTRTKMPVLSFSKRSGALAAWSQIGPENIAGRLSSIAIDPANPNTIYIASAEGGVWKTVNGGASWTPLTDNLETLASGVIAIDPRDGTLYYGTGEAHNSLDSYGGTGVFKSTNGGQTWSKLTNVPTIPETETRFGPTYYFTSVLAVDPVKNRVWLGFLRRRQGMTSFNGALYKSTDGGSSWTRMDPPDQAGNRTGPLTYPFITDLVFDPQKTDILYAASGNAGGPLQDPFSPQGLFKSTDGGTTWTQVSNGLPPAAEMGRINLAISPSNPIILYTSIIWPSTSSNSGKLRGIFKTTDGGSNWTQLVNAPADLTGEQGWYNNVLLVHSTNPDIVFAGGVDLYRSTDGGNSWRNVTTGVTHVDHHALAMNPANSNIIYTGNDGGIYRSLDGGQTWQSLNNGISNTQFYSLALNPKNKKRAHGGTQDNGTVKFNGSSLWSTIFGGDGGDVAVDYAQPETLYTEYIYLDMKRSFNGGASFSTITSGINLNRDTERIAFYAPYDVSKSSPAVIYAGTHRIWKSTNRGTDWVSTSEDLTYGTATISAITIAPSDPNHVYVGTSDGKIWSTSNGGVTWDSASVHPLNLPPPIGATRRFVTDFAVHPANPGYVYIAFSGYNTSHLFRSTDHGGTWSNVSGDLPDVPVNAVSLHPRDGGTTFYVATDVGCFLTLNGGTNWALLGTGLPNVVVHEIAVSDDMTYMRAATHGRSVWELGDVPTAVADGHPFNVVSTYELHQNYPNPFNPETTIKFDLPMAGYVSLKVYDNAGREVATLLNDRMESGRHLVIWDGMNSAGLRVTSGVYYYKLQTQSVTKTKKMILLK